MPPAAASVRVGSKIPKMIGTTQMGTIKLHDYIDGAWTLLLTFPQDFHPVWATELGMLTKLKPQFDARNCRVLGLSVGSLLDGLQLTAYNQVVLPTNWKVNDDVFIEPDITSDAAKALFPHGFHELKPYFRVTPSPTLTEDQS
ncbi:hypothetical protein DYB37_004683 [Aphanomyces astaci]|uniref:Thioredoxin domain-containing protein n=1 Tax=Aphanomyces astaci TaxID=112090 RepID=A0A3R6Y182_APHAT|nr:hypothetical protein DYB37_004683 [Aphanomyces astaci]